MLKSVLRQNFTINPSVLDDVIRSLDLQDDDNIVEIGCGKGILSKQILTHTRKLKSLFLLGYEVDTDWEKDLKALRHSYIKYFNFEIKNFLDANPRQGYNKCTGNIPYHISEPLFFAFLKWNFDEIVMITGIKFARMMTGEISGMLALMSSYLFDSEIVKEYDKNIFFPKSKVDSGLLRMHRKTNWSNLQEEIIAKIFRNYNKNHIWLNNILGWKQSQTGQIYHMNLEKLIQEIKTH